MKILQVLKIPLRKNILCNTLVQNFGGLNFALFAESEVRIEKIEKIQPVKKYMPNWNAQRAAEGGGGRSQYFCPELVA